MTQKEAEAKAQHNWKEAESHAREEKGKVKVCGMSIGCSALLTAFVYRR